MPMILPRYITGMHMMKSGMNSPGFMANWRVLMAGTRVNTSMLSGMATRYSGPEEASNTAHVGTSLPAN